MYEDGWEAGRDETVRTTARPVGSGRGSADLRADDEDLRGDLVSSREERRSSVPDLEGLLGVALRGEDEVEPSSSEHARRMDVRRCEDVSTLSDDRNTSSLLLLTGAVVDATGLVVAFADADVVAPLAAAAASASNPFAHDDLDRAAHRDDR